MLACQIVKKGELGIKSDIFLARLGVAPECRLSTKCGWRRVRLIKN